MQKQPKLEKYVHILSLPVGVKMFHNLGTFNKTYLADLASGMIRDPQKAPRRARAFGQGAFNLVMLGWLTLVSLVKVRLSWSYKTSTATKLTHFYTDR